MDDLAGILLALIFAGLLIALVKGGWTGPGGARDWFRIKFLGKVPGG